ncbi:Xylulose-5-phosphate phosphoketolase [Mycoplasmopsis arginini]|nr:Xylulose-5-phosphate phosphoketolase [Chlamydia abortus]SGA25312.1 Xylulose-5-phosphate phosphoketolase [Mycoplasmopsis arginini]SGA27250.1 Xylulose-5-phosphate phosphoketolase [Mycoplasmopsis arginini]SGA30637.1 Xylulose-5-phosphate phosphoketolase [Chlamydia abortus]
MVELGKYMADTVVKNPNNFRVFGPDETKSNRLFALFDVTKRQ